VPDLVALAMPAGPQFVEQLLAAWDAGDAVVPIDHRLPAPAVRQLLDALRPSAIVDDAGSRTSLDSAVSVEQGDALVVATSGTTGAPKGVVLTHDAVAASAKATSARLAVDPARDRWLCVLPVAHIGGLSVVTRALATGTPLTFDASDERATLTSVVPTQANRMDLGRFRAVLVGGSADWRDRPDSFVRTYGMTETGSGIAYDGRALEGVDVRVDESTSVIYVRGSMLLRAYRAGADGDGSSPLDAARWFCTGDAGHFDTDSRLIVAGRIGDLIVTGGEKVWPTTVEDALRSHPDIVDAAVTGALDPEWGQRVVAWIVPRTGAVAPSLDALRDWTKATLPAYAAPREVIAVAALPRTVMGKLIRKDLAYPVRERGESG